MKLSEYVKLDAVALANLVKKREVKKSELIELSLARLSQVNNKLNAVTYVRKEQALQEAQAADDLAFQGVPIFLKDISQTIKCEPSTSGAKLLKDERAGHTAHFVRDLYDAGLISLGNSTTPEFALKNITEPALHGATRNPWQVEHSPGGSSGGAAALVAAGVVAVAGASDGGGSIRIPASFTNLVGLKPSRGRTAVGPGLGRKWQGAAIDFVLTRSVRDTARALDGTQVLQPEAAFQVPLFKGSYETEMKRPFDKQLRIGFALDSPVATPVSEEAKEAVRKTVTWLEQEGHHVEEVSHPVDGEQLMREYYIMNSGEMAAVMRHYETYLQRKLTATDVEIESWLLYRAGEKVRAADFTASLAAWDIAAAKMAAFHQTYDFFITPATAFSAPKIGEFSYGEKQKQAWIEQIEAIDFKEQQALIYDMFLPSLTYTPFTQLANITGQPAISLPVHITKEGMPLGVHIMASKGEEAQLLQVAHMLEASSIWEGMRDTALTFNLN